MLTGYRRIAPAYGTSHPNATRVSRIVGLMRENQGMRLTVPDPLAMILLMGLFPVGGFPMTSDERERMNLLCAQIQEEKNYNRFIALLRDLNGLIERKERRLDHHPDHGVWQRTKPWRTVHGTVKRIVRPVHPEEPEKVEIAIAGAEDLFREIRIENKLTDVDGSPVALTDGAQVDVTFEADVNDTVRIKTNSAN